MTMLIDKYILRLDVPVHYAIPMDFFDSQQDFCQIDSCLFLCQSLKRLLVYNRSHITTRAIVSNHVQILECLECIVDLCHKSVIDLSLNLFFSNDESCQTIIGTLFHTLHRIKFASALFFRSKAFNKVHLAIGTAT